MKTGLDRLPRQTKTRPASRFRRQYAASEIVDRRSEGATQYRLAHGIHNSPAMQLQREKINGSFGHPVQRVGEEEEELLQGKFDALQRQPEEEELMQGKFAAPAQREAEAAKTQNKTGLPGNLNGLDH